MFLAFGGVQCRSHIEIKYLKNLRVCANIVIDEPEHLYLVGQYKHRPTYYMYTADVCGNNHKDINEGLHSFQFVLKKYDIFYFEGREFP